MSSESNSPWPPGLEKLAGAYGALTAYHDIEGKLHAASPEGMMAILRALGAELSGERDIARALRARRLSQWERWLSPSTALWPGTPAEVEIRLPEPAPFASLHCAIELEWSERMEWRADLADLPAAREKTIAKKSFTSRTLRLPRRPPLGFHRLVVEAAGRREESLLIAAPRHCYLPPDAEDQKHWGAFLPLYALRTERSLGCGDFSDMEALAEWVASLGGGIVATLPFLASFLDFPFDPSPYSPASRLFWNELYVDPRRAPELSAAPNAQAILDSPAFKSEMAALADRKLADYRPLYAAKREVLAELSRAAFASGSRDGIDDFLRRRPEAEDYARFRAAVERRRETWHAWPARMRQGRIAAGDFDPAARDYHLYVQYLADRQVESMAARASAHGPGLYLDMTLGVNGGGYDVWRHPEEFASGISAGAPPDGFFTKGQNWGFPPLHPIRMGGCQFEYWRAALAHHMRHAGILRLDHIMGLNRLYWVPQGAEATEGVYVRYPHRELYATLCLESRRNQCMIVGEDLGTVPPEVRETMTRRRMSRMYVGQFEATPDPDATMGAPGGDVAAGMNTHDTPTFAAFWSGADIDDRKDLGLLNEEQATSDRRWREGQRWALAEFLRRKGLVPAEGEVDAPSALAGCLKWLAASPARIALVNLEDLWGEPDPQNTPGTFEERPNWRRRAARSLEEMKADAGVESQLRELTKLRRTEAKV